MKTRYYLFRSCLAVAVSLILIGDALNSFALAQDIPVGRRVVIIKCEPGQGRGMGGEGKYLQVVQFGDSDIPLTPLAKIGDECSKAVAWAISLMVSPTDYKTELEKYVAGTANGISYTLIGYTSKPAPF